MWKNWQRGRERERREGVEVLGERGVGGVELED